MYKNRTANMKNEIEIASTKKAVQQMLDTKAEMESNIDEFMSKVGT